MLKYQDTGVRLTLDDILNLSPQHQKQLFDAMKYDICLFAWICFPHIIKEIPDFHKEIYHIWDNVSKMKLDFAGIVVYRGSAKSTIKNIVIIHAICYNLEPMILFLSEAEDQAMRDIDSVEDEIETNPLIHAIFGNLKGEGVWNRSEAEFSNGVYAVSKGWKSRSRGIKHKNQRPTLIILDDFEGEDNSDTQGKRAKLAEWIEKVVIPAGDVECRVVFMGTVVHTDAYLANLKDHGIMNMKRSAYYEKTISEYTDENGNIKKDFEGNYPTWPKRYTKRWIQTRKAIYFEGTRPKPWLYYQEYFNMPGTMGEPKFNMSLVTPVKAELKNYKRFTWLQKDNLQIPVYLFTGIDPAHSAKSTSNYTSIVTIAIDPDENVYIINMINEQMEIITQTDRVFKECVEHSSKQCTVETYGYQKALEVWLRKKILDNNKSILVQEFKEGKGKSAKWLEGLCPVINSGKVFYLDGCPNIDVLFEQANSYTGGLRDYNDMLDALFLALHNTFVPPRMNVKKVLTKLRKQKAGKKRRKSWLSI